MEAKFTTPSVRVGHQPHRHGSQMAHPRFGIGGIQAPSAEAVETSETVEPAETSIRDIAGPVTPPPVSVQGHGVDAVRAGRMLRLADTFVEFLGDPTELALRIRSGTARGRCQSEQLLAGGAPGRQQIERDCGSRGSLPQFAGEGRCGLAERYPVEDRLAPLLGLFQLLPPSLLPIRGLCRATVPEHVRMPAYQLVDQFAGHIVDI